MYSLAIKQTHLSKCSSFRGPDCVFLCSCVHLFLVLELLNLLCKLICVGIDGEVCCKEDD